MKDIINKITGLPKSFIIIFTLTFVLLYPLPKSQAIALEEGCSWDLGPIFNPNVLGVLGITNGYCGQYNAPPATYNVNDQFCIKQDLVNSSANNIIVKKGWGVSRVTDFLDGTNALDYHISRTQRWIISNHFTVGDVQEGVYYNEGPDLSFASGESKTDNACWTADRCGYFQFDLLYYPVNFTPNYTCTPGANYNCPTAGFIRVVGCDVPTFTPTQPPPSTPTPTEIPTPTICVEEPTPTLQPSAIPQPTVCVYPPTTTPYPPTTTPGPSVCIENSPTPTPTVPVASGCLMEIIKKVVSVDNEEKLTASVNSIIKYRIEIRNNGNESCDGGGSRIRDYVSQSLAFVTDSNQEGGSNLNNNAVPGYANWNLWDRTSRYLRWNMMELDPGEYVWVEWYGKVKKPVCVAPGEQKNFTIENLAQATAIQFNDGTEYYPEPTNWIDSNTTSVGVAYTCPETSSSSKSQTIAKVMGVADVKIKEPSLQFEENPIENDQEQNCEVSFETLAENICQTDPGNFIFKGSVIKAPNGAKLVTQWYNRQNQKYTATTAIPQNKPYTFQVEAAWPGRRSNTEDVMLKATAKVVDRQGDTIPNCSAATEKFYHPDNKCNMKVLKKIEDLNSLEKASLKGVTSTLPKNLPTPSIPPVTNIIDSIFNVIFGR